jgi:hypothetical protein
MLWQRRQPVIVAVVFEPDRGFFVTFNDKWQGYAFPMRKRRPTDAGDDFTAREALRDAVNLRLPRAEAKPLEYVEHRGTSGRTGRDTVYQYQAFEVDPRESLPAGGLGSRHGFLGREQLLEADMVTWSTKRILQELLDNQEVAAAVICRPGASGREFLMVRSANYRGYFFPAARFKTASRPAWSAVEAVRHDTGFFGPMSCGEAVAVRDVHDSPRFQCQRGFVFHLVPVRLAGVDLSAAPNRLEESLLRTGVLWRWVEEDELATPALNGLSPTVASLREAAARACDQSGPP